MNKLGFNFPKKPRKTALYEVEDWYQKLLAEKLGREYEPIKRSNFGEYDMAVNYITSVLEESKAIEKVAIFNIDHMAQIRFTGADAACLLDKVLPANVLSMKIGQCKYTILLKEDGGVVDDLIIMRIAEADFILVINAGHDITDLEKGMKADIDYIMDRKKADEDVQAVDISDQVVKIDIQGPLSYKLVTSLYGNSVVKNRHKPQKNMRFFTFNEFEYEGHDYIISRTGYTNRWGWELYVPAPVAEEQFKRIVKGALELGGLLVGLGGRDENRISAGDVGLPLYGNEYDQQHTPTNCPLFAAAIDMTKDDFVGKKALQADIEAGVDKRMVLIISEGIAVNRGVYKDGKRLGSITSSITSPNVPQEKREFLNSKRKSVNGAEGTAAIGLAWLYHNPYQVDENGKDITKTEAGAVRIAVELYREDKQQLPTGKPLKGYISGDGVNPATAPKPLRHIQDL